MVTGALLPQGRDSVLADVSGEDATTRHHSAPDSKTLPFASPASPRLNPTGPQDSPDGIFSPDFSPDRPSGMKKATRRWPMLLFYLVGASGFEPPTPTMSRWCSNQLSYAPAKEANDTRFQAVLASEKLCLQGQKTRVRACSCLQGAYRLIMTKAEISPAAPGSRPAGGESYPAGAPPPQIPGHAHAGTSAAPAA